VGAPQARASRGVTRRSHRVFLLSPANCSGRRARMLRAEGADHPLARRLRDAGGAELGEVFAFVSSLYFRGKLAYARAFARPPQGTAGIRVITPCDGLLPPEAAVSASHLERFAGVPVDAGEPRYAAAEVVLLGSVASPKYADLIAPVLGDRLVFPSAFVGRGDMSRGGLMLRSVQEARELEYVPLAGAVRHGPRPARLEPIRK